MLYFVECDLIVWSKCWDHLVIIATVGIIDFYFIFINANLDSWLSHLFLNPEVDHHRKLISSISINNNLSIL